MCVSGFISQEAQTCGLRLRKVGSPVPRASVGFVALTCSVHVAVCPHCSLPSRMTTGRGHPRPSPARGAQHLTGGHCPHQQGHGGQRGGWTAGATWGSLWLRCSDSWSSSPPSPSFCCPHPVAGRAGALRHHLRGTLHLRGIQAPHSAHWDLGTVFRKQRADMPRIFVFRALLFGPHLFSLWSPIGFYGVRILDSPGPEITGHCAICCLSRGCAPLHPLPGVVLLELRPSCSPCSRCRWSAPPMASPASTAWDT